MRFFKKSINLIRGLFKFLYEFEATYQQLHMEDKQILTEFKKNNQF